MQILIVGPAYPLRGGIAALNERLAQALQNERHTVEILSFAYQYPDFLFPGTSQFGSDAAPDKLTIHTELHSLNPFNWWSVGKKYAARKYDVVIFRFWLPFMAPCLGTVARIFRRSSTPVIAITDNVIPHEKRIGDKLLTRYFLRACDAFLAMSQAVMDDLRRFEPNKPTVYAPHPLYDSYGVAIGKQQARQYLDLHLDAKYVLFFGLIRAYKGLDILLHALADKRLAERNVRLIIAGEPYEDLAKYRQLIAQLQLENRICAHWHFVPQREVAAYFCAADIVAQPYKTATQSGVTQIAYHFNRPMLVTNVGGLSEIVPHGKVGYVTAINPQAVADALVDFYDNMREQQFAENIAKEKTKYEWAYFIKQLLSLLPSKGNQ
jgi:glycosyltransferase involved in cell wall biosynthesis